MLLCFLDESGDHILSGGDPNYPVFVLAGVVVEFLSEERRDRAKIFAESRSSSLDQRLERTWEGLLEKGTPYVRAQRLRRRVEGLIFKKKGGNEAGLQLADLVASPIGRRYLGKPAKEDWEIVAGKLRNGLVVFPKS
jgi:hypothetical protein